MLGRQLGTSYDDAVDEINETRRCVTRFRTRVIAVTGLLAVTSALAVIGFSLTVTADVRLFALYETDAVNDYLLCALIVGVLLLALFAAEMLASMAWTDARSYRLWSPVASYGDAEEEEEVRSTPVPSSSGSLQSSNSQC